MNLPENTFIFNVFVYVGLLDSDKNHNHDYFDQYCNHQCWGKLFLKVMHYNIALLPKKVTNYIT